MSALSQSKSRERERASLTIDPFHIHFCKVNDTKWISNISLSRIKLSTIHLRIKVCFDVEYIISILLFKEKILLTSSLVVSSLALFS